MDDYIKRKRKDPNAPLAARPQPQSLGQIIVRQSTQQIEDLTLKLKFVQERVFVLRQKLFTVKNQIDSRPSTHSPVLGTTSSQKSPVTHSVFDGKTSNSNQKVQQNLKLGTNEGMVNGGSSTGPQRQTVDSTNDKHAQSSERTIRKRRTRI